MNLNLFKRASTLALALVVTVTCLSGCGTSAPSSGFTAPESIDLSTVTDPILTVSGMSSDTVMATAGELEITAADLLYWIAYDSDTLLEYYNTYSSNTLETLPWENEIAEGVTFADRTKENALETAALYALLPELAKAEKLELSAEFQTSFDNSMDTLETQLGSQELLEQYLWCFPLTKDAYKDICISEEYNTLLVEHMYGENSEGYPTDQEILDYLENERQLYSVKHILLMTVDSATYEPLDEETAAQKKATAEDLLKQLRESSDPSTLFDQLMNEYSEDSGLSSYPDGYHANELGYMVPEFEEASLALEPGEISGLVETDYGYHIILRLPLGVSPSDYVQDYIAQRVEDYRQQVLTDANVTTTEHYDNLDVAAFYTALGILRNAVNDEMLAVGDAKLNEDASSSSTASSTAANTQD